MTKKGIFFISGYRDATCLVTGCAGFIGSHLCEALLKLNYKVVGIDCFSDYYSREFKDKNIQKCLKSKNFELIEEDLLKCDLSQLINGVDYIFHQAAQAGVRASWGDNFKIYTDNNILATQKLLESCKNSTQLKKFVYASSSSVYGDSELPMRERNHPRPISPYGVSKLAAEHLCYLYWKNYSTPTITLRYFTVYGPRQRPDMAFHKFIKAILEDLKILIFGDGKQTRDFTYISDAVDANILAMENKVAGEVFNIGGGSRVTINEVIRLLERILMKKANVRYVQEQKGDVLHTLADTTKSREILTFKPRVSIEEGLAAEVAWLQQLSGK